MGTYSLGSSYSIESIQITKYTLTVLITIAVSLLTLYYHYNCTMSCRKKSLFLHPIVIITLICIHTEANKSVVYHVSPTKQLDSCPRNSTCQPDQHCHKLDYFAQNSKEFFSQNDTNITLIFMCGVHIHTNRLMVQNVNTFVMKGAEKSNKNVIINHKINAKHGKQSYTAIQFFNVSYVIISTLTMIRPSIIVNQSLIEVKSCKIYGYMDTKESLSYMNITGRYSQALLDNCTFKENCFIMSDSGVRITVSNSIFRSYNHQNISIITASSSVVKITGNVNFTDSIKVINPYEYSTACCGTAILLKTINSQHRSSLNITSGATVYFVNLTCQGNGGALYSENGLINISAKAEVVFMQNVANAGGAIILKNGEITMQFNSNLTFSNNFANLGGAAVGLMNSTIHTIGTNTINFHSNKGAVGGALYLEFGTLNISSNSSVKFTTNNAHVEGGAIHIERGVPSSIIVDNFAKLLFLNNSAFRGGAFYIKPSSFAIKAGYHSSLKFVNNTALHIGGAIYCEMQSAIPCTFMITDYSAEISFRGNHANGNVGHHMYGSSVRNRKCDKEHLEFYYKQAKPYCWKQHETTDKHVNISFDPDQLSPVSSAPRRVCLCDVNSKPQCANFSLIFTNIKAYRGEIFQLSAFVVGYNFGTTVGTVYARFLHSDPFTRAHLEKLQYNQLINNSEVCTNLKYSVSTTSHTEILLLQTSVLPVPVYSDETAANTTNLSVQKGRINQFIDDYTSHNGDGCLSESLLRTPIFINITLLPGCPQGLTLNADHTKCQCYPVLAINGFKCSVENKTGYLEWNNTGWVNATRHGNGVIYNSLCPLNYCKLGKKRISIRDNPRRQCASNRTGILCGACLEDLSLAIGSSRCIECHNRHNMTLLLVFAAAGVFLVLFILTFDFTVTQGYVNGLIFYANIVWTYKIILFPTEGLNNYGNNWVLFLNGFIAWLNLDFGIESCFIVGLNAYWKTWLQFVFPFYIWIIAGVITVICHYSSRLTNLIGSRAVPLLATLFLLSYMKLLRTGVDLDATSIAIMEKYPENTSYTVWYLDGNLRYCHSPHTYLLIAAILIFVFLWLPYTLLLLFIQPLR